MTWILYVENSRLIKLEKYLTWRWSGKRCSCHSQSHAFLNDWPVVISVWHFMWWNCRIALADQQKRLRPMTFHCIHKYQPIREMICMPTLKQRNPSAPGENSQKTLETRKRFSMPVSITSRTKTWRPKRRIIHLEPTGEKRLIWTKWNMSSPVIFGLSPAGLNEIPHYFINFSPDLRTLSTAQSNKEHVIGAAAC